MRSSGLRATKEIFTPRSYPEARLTLSENIAGFCVESPGRRRLVFSEFRPYTVIMKNDVVPVQIRGILPANSGCALFVGNDDKVFVINVEPQMGAIIGMFLRDQPKERPLT